MKMLVLTLSLLGIVACGGGGGTTSSGGGVVVPPDPQPLKVGIFRAVKADAQGVNGTLSNQNASANQTREMSFARRGHKSILLSNGNVFLVGGEMEGGLYLPHSSGEIFNSQTERFSPSNATFNFLYHDDHVNASFVAVQLPNDKVVLAGGYNSTWSNHQSIEIYDRQTDTVTLVNNALPDPTTNIEHGFYMGSNKILFTGLRYKTPDNYVAVHTYAVVYDVETNTSVKVHHGYNYMDSGAVQVSNGDVYFFGGSSYSLDVDRQSFKEVIKCSAEDLLAGRPPFSWFAELMVPRYGFGIVQLNANEVGIYGGFNWTPAWPADPLRLKTVEIFNLQTKTSTSRVSLMSEVGFLTSVLLQHNNYTLHAGGVDETGFTANTEYVHNASANVSGSTGTLLEARRFHSVTALNNGMVLISGGEYQTQASTKKTAEIYDSQNKLYITFPSDMLTSGSVTTFNCDYAAGVNWSVTPEVDGEDAGNITSEGIYTAPEVSRMRIVIIKAIAKDNANINASIRVRVIPN